jgi:hypothetical protein
MYFEVISLLSSAIYLDYNVIGKSLFLKQKIKPGILLFSQTFVIQKILKTGHFYSIGRKTE